MLQIPKFPQLILRGETLIWDSRQIVSGSPERVFIFDGLAPEIHRSLRERTHGTQVVTEARRALGIAADQALGHPSRALTIAAVTGTNGKTTCAQILRRVFVSAGFATAEIGTLGVSVYRDGDNENAWLKAESGFTTPEAPALHWLLRELCDRGVTHVAMEASSHAMALDRMAGVDLAGALFTNLSQDHLDFHGDMKAYEAAKLKLFTDYLQQSTRSRRVAVLNTSDPVGARWSLEFPQIIKKTEILTYEQNKTYWLTKNNLSGLYIREGQADEWRSSLVGSFNAENLAGSLMLARALLPPAEAQSKKFTSLVEQALDGFSGPPGRMQRIASDDHRYVFVDYAHSPDALEKVLQVLREALAPGARLTVVFGCGGDRDRGKRPLMGAIAARLADHVIVTSDNPRTEPPLAILEEIKKGLEGSLTTYELIEDRETAIVRGVAGMTAGDACLVAGKGHENFQIIGQERRPFSDEHVVSKALVAAR